MISYIIISAQAAEELKKIQLAKLNDELYTEAAKMVSELAKGIGEALSNLSSAFKDLADALSETCEDQEDSL